jgi:hypothetical protein
MKIYNDVLSLIKKCEDNFRNIGVAAQEYLDVYDDYVENKNADSFSIKKKIKEKIVRVFDENK